jgi:alginate O-acetyltransferase complex protein AlgI
MIFTSAEFLLFFLVSYPAYLLLRRRSWPAAKLLLLVASLLCYSAWYYPYTAILLAIIAVDFTVGLVLERIERPFWRRAVLAGSICANLGLLGLFKYSQFAAEQLAVLLALAGVTVTLGETGWLLPLGISFHTFQGMSYTLDIYKRRARAHGSLADFALYVAFFPQLVAGPIVRARNFLPQLAKVPRILPATWYWGAFLVILGSFKKLVVADNLAPYVDWFFALPSYETVHGLTAVYAMLAYSVQIYSDFSGYSDIAVGLAAMLGFRFPYNFYYPYIALGFSDFWRRWHITLSEWIRDYVYVPLGGSRVGPSRTVVNLTLTMGLAGLWHGASWLFVAWGLLHGLFLVLDHLVLQRWVLPRCGFASPSGVAWSLGTRAVTFALVTLAWLLFRGQSWQQVTDILTAAFTHHGGSYDQATQFRMAQYWVIPLLMHLAVLLRFGDRLHRRFGRGVLLAAACLMSLAILFFKAVDTNAFIYFAF